MVFRTCTRILRNNSVGPAVSPNNPRGAFT